MTRTILRAYRTELDPNKEQRQTFVKCCGAARYVYNWALNDRIERYKTGTSTNLYEQKRRFNGIKDELCPWVRELPYTLTESAFANLDRAYQNFFRRVKGGAEQKGFPKFKSRKNGLGSFTLRGCIHIDEAQIKLPVIGWVRLKEHGYLPRGGVKILSANVSERAGRWFVSLQVEQEQDTPEAAQGKPIGVDLGITTLATCSDGAVFDNQRALGRYEARLKRLNRELSRRKKGGRNREKTKRQIARVHYRVTNIRTNAIHQATHYLTAKSQPSVLVIEDLNVAGMLKNGSLSKAIADASFYEFRRQLEYKCNWYGVDLLIAGRFFPSSKKCSSCGSVKPLLRLSERRFVCETCGVVIERDLNAALNLAALAVKRTVTACGQERLQADVSPVLLDEAGTEDVTRTESR